MRDLEKQLKELQQLINSYKFPLTLSQVQELDTLKKQEKELKALIFIKRYKK